MSDLISRQAAIDAIDDWWITVGDKRHPADVIKALPSAQPEIIHCKDCRKHNVSSGYKMDCCALYEWRGISYGHEHDYQYCCYAERRIDEPD